VFLGVGVSTTSFLVCVGFVVGSSIVGVGDANLGSRVVFPDGDVGDETGVGISAGSFFDEQAAKENIAEVDSVRTSILRDRFSVLRIVCILEKYSLYSVKPMVWLNKAKNYSTAAVLFLYFCRAGTIES
jgi:hypothetical protein